MRPFLFLILLGAGACSVRSDASNEQVTLQYDKERIRNTAVEAGRTARSVASGVGNVAVAAGRAIRNEVGGVEVEVRRTPPPKGE